MAPVYLDSELGIKDALGANNDIGIGFAGGGFAESHTEIRGGHYFPEESYQGNGAKASLSLYHLFNTGQRIPLNGVLRTTLQYSAYESRSENPPDFLLPRSHLTGVLRGGLRWGGKAPMLRASPAMELSSWYEGRWRDREGTYGFAGDRDLKRQANFFWGRALLDYTLPSSGKKFSASIMAGTSANADRINAYRLGGSMQMVSEFPLIIPGYFNQELSARRYALFRGSYGIPLRQNRRMYIGLRGTAAYVNYLPGFEQPGSLNSGASWWTEYDSPHRTWKVLLDYGYGFQAIRSGTRGAHSVSLMLQCNMRADGVPPPAGPYLDRPFWRFLEQLKP